MWLAHGANQLAAMIGHFQESITQDCRLFECALIFPKFITQECRPAKERDPLGYGIIKI